MSIKDKKQRQKNYNERQQTKTNVEKTQKAKTKKYNERQKAKAHFK